MNQRCFQYPQGVNQAIEPARLQDRLIEQGDQAWAQGQQVAGQIAAVHRRDVGRVQGLQGLGVIPVIKVASMALKACLLYTSRCV